jgi:hypothetical protein
MKPIKSLSLLWGVLLVSLTLMSGCFADNSIPQAPTNQLIKGPFTIGPEWQTITPDKPLATLPHIQTIDLLLNPEEYQGVDITKNDEFNILNASYKQGSTGVIIHPEIILIDDQEREFRGVMKSTGYREVDDQLYNFLAYGTNSTKNIFYFPTNTKFVAIKLRTNVTMKIEHLSWVAPYYYKNPAKKWEDVNPSKILDFK